MNLSQRQPENTSNTPNTPNPQQDPQPHLIRATRIQLTLHRSELWRIQTREPEQITLQGVEHDDVWQTANDILADWATTAPQHHYHDVDFVVMYRDTVKFRGHLQLAHLATETPDLAKHMRDTVALRAGTLRPPWMPDVIARLLYQSRPGEFKAYGEFVSTHEIGRAAG